jgi:hypothetical protein
MRIVRKVITLLLAALVAAPSGASANGQHVVPPAALAAAVARHLESQSADRAAVRDALTSPQVRKIAERLGADVDRAVAALDTLADAELARAAAAARQINQQLVGGQSITLTTTTIIIALLIVILIIVAVD